MAGNAPGVGGTVCQATTGTYPTCISESVAPPTAQYSQGMPQPVAPAHLSSLCPLLSGFRWYALLPSSPPPLLPLFLQILGQRPPPCGTLLCPPSSWTTPGPSFLCPQSAWHFSYTPLTTVCNCTCDHGVAFECLVVNSRGRKCVDSGSPLPAEGPAHGWDCMSHWRRQTSGAAPLEGTGARA